MRILGSNDLNEVSGGVPTIAEAATCIAALGAYNTTKNRDNAIAAAAACTSIVAEGYSNIYSWFEAAAVVVSEAINPTDLIGGITPGLVEAVVAGPNDGGAYAFELFSYDMSTY